MNRKRRACLIVGFLLLAAATLFPPWRSSMGRGRFSSSYGFLFDPPYSGDTVELSRLFVEWLLVALVTGGSFYLLKGQDSPRHEARITSGERNWRLRFWLLIASYVLIAALGTTSYLLFRKVKRLKAGIQNTIVTIEAQQVCLVRSRETLIGRVNEDRFALTVSPFTMDQRLLQDKTDTLQQLKEELYKLH